MTALRRRHRTGPRPRALPPLLLLFLLLAPLTAGGPPVRDLAPAEAGFAPYLRFTPTSTAGRVDWLLVTTAELSPAFEPLVRHRRDLGLACEVVTVEEVARDALLGGGDLPERVRNFVRYLADGYGLRYLLLGADSELLPSRMAPFPIKGQNLHYGEPYAVEGWFGCLEGEWNADADARIGEAEPGDDDRPDLAARVHVGRVPAEDVREVEAWVRKVLLYERPLHLDHLDRAVFLGGKVFVEGDADAHYRDLFAKRFGPAGFRADFFTTEGGPAQVLAALSAGAGIVSHYHHSFTYNLSLAQGAIDTGNVGEIANAERPFLFFSNGCYSNQFTKEGISEKMLLSPAGGAAAFVGSTNTCFTSSLGLERRFWDHLFAGGARTLGEALSAMRAEVAAGTGPLGFLRLSFALLGDPATPPWLARPARAEVAVAAGKDGRLAVRRKGDVTGRVFASCVQEGRFGAVRETLAFPGGGDEVVFPPVVGNGAPLRVTLFGDRVVPVTVETPDPVKTRLTGLDLRDGALVAALAGAAEAVFPLGDPIPEGPVRFEREVEGALLRVAVPALSGRDRLIAREGGGLRIPGFLRMAPPRPEGLPLLVPGPDLELPAGAPGPAPGEVLTEATDSTLRVAWGGDPAARWLVERETDDGRVLLTPVPLVNPFFELTGLPALTPVRLLLSRAAGGEATPVTASTTFPFQRGFPQRIGANVTSVQVLDLDGRRGQEVLFGDDKLGLWALRADGSEVRHAGDAWTFGLFAAVEDGVFEPVVADIAGSKRPEVLATGKLNDRSLHAFDLDGRPLPGFPVKFGSRLMTPPLVGDFDGKKGVEILVVSGFGKTVELVRPDGTKEPYATIGQYNYGYPIAANLDRDKALEVVLLDGDGKVRVLDQGGAEMKGFPVDLGGPGRATPMLADLDGKKGLEIVAVGKGTTRVAVIDPLKGKVLADLSLPGAGEPSNYSLFYPGLAVLSPKAAPSVIVGTPSKKLFALDYREKEGLAIRDGWPIDLPAEARGVAAADTDGDGRDELFLSIFNGEVWGIDAEGRMLPGFPLRTGADTYAVPLLADLDGDGDLELFLGAADGVLRVFDLPYRLGRRTPTWCGLLNGAGMPGMPGDGAR